MDTSGRQNFGPVGRLELSNNYYNSNSNELPVLGDIKAETKCHQGTRGNSLSV